jgi:hypothetical protein
LPNDSKLKLPRFDPLDPITRASRAAVIKEKIAGRMTIA